MLRELLTGCTDVETTAAMIRIGGGVDAELITFGQSIETCSKAALTFAALKPDGLFGEGFVLGAGVATSSAVADRGFKVVASPGGTGRLTIGTAIGAGPG